MKWRSTIYLIDIRVDELRTSTKRKYKKEPIRGKEYSNK